MLSPKERLSQYGISNDIEILGAISLACTVLGNGGNDNANLLMEKTARVESHLANYRDEKPEHGESAFQFDEGTFDWIIRKISTGRRYLHHIANIEKHYNFDITKIEYSDLRNNINASALLCRLRYKFVTEAIPEGDYAQWEYYKTHWNSSEGEGDYPHWEELVQDCHFEKR